MTTPHESTLPATCAWAFKEWSGVCRALAEGRQSIILRKGGIAEANGRFTPDHTAFWLYPTRLHESQQGAREESASAPADAAPGFVSIEALAAVACVGHTTRLEALEQLADLHIWTDETIVRKFHYRTPGLWVLGVRVYRLGEPVAIAASPAHSGCKSWGELEPPITTKGLRPALSDSDFERQMEKLAALVDPARAGQPA